tara:strand:- start:3480 stop:4148 length:669 start_codon:yes stop_codon:yes gene_type:complete
MLSQQGTIRKPMKEHTKAVLEACTGQLVALGLTRRRRGLAVWQMNDEMWGGVGMQVQIMRDNSVRVVPVPQVVWDPVERLVAHGKGLGYRPWSPTAITRSRVVLPSKQVGPFAFPEPELHGSVLDRFGSFVRAKLIPVVLEMADEREILRHYRREAPKGVGRAEHALAILAWTSKTLDLTEDFGSLLSVQPEEEKRARLEAFHHRLCGSEEVRELIGPARFG